MAKEPKPKGRRRRGRPEGISLKEQDRQLLLGAIEAGGTDHAAAQAAGISERTFRDWRARAEGRHPTRRATPELLTLFEQIAAAKARARLKREIVVAERDPKHWLRYQARSRAGLDGWTDPVQEPPSEKAAELYAPTPEEFAEVVTVLAVATGITGRRCSDSDCSCADHQEESSDEA
jgi:hypothetical protein